MARSRGSLGVPGPVGRIQDAVRVLEWRWPEPFVFMTAAGQTLDITKVDRGEWEHAVRKELRMQAWKQAAARREDMQGVEVGVQREITLCLLEHGDLTPMEQALLRAILAGGVWTQDPLHRARLTNTATCPHCQTGEVEDHEHMWWRCPAWQEIRQRFAKASALETKACPTCFIRCSIVPNDMQESSGQTTEERREVGSSGAEDDGKSAKIFS